MQEFWNNVKISRAIKVLFVLVVVLLIFEAGIYVGYRRGVFAHEWNEMYVRGPGDPRSPFAPFMRDIDSPNPHGAAGTIVSVHLPIVMIKGQSSAEELVHVTSATTLHLLREVASTSDLVVGRQVIVIGSPGSDGQINADFIRIFPNYSTSTRP